MLLSNLPLSCWFSVYSLCTLDDLCRLDTAITNNADRGQFRSFFENSNAFVIHSPVTDRELNYALKRMIRMSHLETVQVRRFSIVEKFGSRSISKLTTLHLITPRTLALDEFSLIMLFNNCPLITELVLFGVEDFTSYVASNIYPTNLAQWKRITIRDCSIFETGGVDYSFSPFIASLSNVEELFIDVEENRNPATQSAQLIELLISTAFPKIVKVHFHSQLPAPLTVCFEKHTNGLYSMELCGYDLTGNILPQMTQNMVLMSICVRNVIGIDDNDIQYICTQSGQTLRNVELSNCGAWLTVNAVRSVVRHCDNISTLTLDGFDHITSNELQTALTCNSSGLSQLRSLHLTKVSLTAQDLSFICDKYPELRVLEVSSSAIHFVAAIIIENELNVAKFENCSVINLTGLA